MKKNNNVNVDLGLEIALTASAYRMAGQKTLKVHGCDNITREQLGILLLLSLKDGLYQAQIASIMGKDRPNITRMIDVLETNGFIVREKDDNNRRILKVHLTQKGKERCEETRPLKERMNVAQYKNMSDDEILILVSLLQRVRENLTEEYQLND